MNQFCFASNPFILHT